MLFIYVDDEQKKQNKVKKKAQMIWMLEMGMLANHKMHSNRYIRFK